MEGRRGEAAFREILGRGQIARSGRMPAASPSRLLRDAAADDGIWKDLHRTTGHNAGDSTETNGTGTVIATPADIPLTMDRQPQPEHDSNLIRHPSSDQARGARDEQITESTERSSGMEEPIIAASIVANAHSSIISAASFHPTTRTAPSATSATSTLCHSPYPWQSLSGHRRRHSPVAVPDARC